jgi:hypothetical protein
MNTDGLSEPPPPLPRVLGQDRLLALLDACGGLDHVYIPRRATLGHPWLRVLTTEEWSKVTDAMGGERVFLPRYFTRAQKKVDVLTLAERGVTTRQISLEAKVGVGERYVRQMLKNDGYDPSQYSDSELDRVWDERQRANEQWLREKACFAESTGRRISEMHNARTSRWEPSTSSFGEGREIVSLAPPINSVSDAHADLGVDGFRTPDDAESIVNATRMHQDVLHAAGFPVSTTEAYAHVTAKWPDEPGFDAELQDRIYATRVQRYQNEMAKSGLSVGADEAAKFVAAVDNAAAKLRQTEAAYGRQIAPTYAYERALKEVQSDTPRQY